MARKKARVIQTDHIDISLEGEEDMLALLSALETGMQRKVVRAGAREAAKVVQTRAKELVPTKTGKLRRSIKVRTMKGLGRKGNIGYSVLAGGTAKDSPFYAGFLEFGTQRITPRPFMRPAANESKEQVKKVFVDKLSEVIRDTLKHGERFGGVVVRDKKGQLPAAIR